MDGLERSDLGLLLDWREARLVSDPVLLRAIVRGTDAVAHGFLRLAMLIKTPLGKLQIGRLERSESRESPIIFSDDAAAVEYISREADAPISLRSPSTPPYRVP